MTPNLSRNRPPEEYTKLLLSGMFWEFHPELTGEWLKDKQKWWKSKKRQRVVRVGGGKHG